MNKLEKLKNTFVKIGKFLVTPPNPKENVIQYLFRYFLLVDSKGNPSWTVTILFYSLVIVAFVTATEIQLATSYVMTYNDQGTMISQAVRGFSSEFYYLVILFVGMIVWFFKLREDKKSKKDSDGTKVEQADSTISTIIDSAKEVISSISKK